ncbi:MAG: restriction endonuclease subunit S [Oceanospirillaceae bacterium]|nr:restriction endonuclease subunit S [Oceanospirillaceae bacterium]
MSEPSHSPIDNLITEHIDIWTSAIKRKSSSGRGSSKKIELYGIKKLRELILELAVRGKLVAQDPNDKPASVLLERIAAEKALLVKEGKIKKPKKLPEISDDEKPFELPGGWEWSYLSEIYDIRDGTHDTPKYQESGYPLVTSKNLSSGKLNLDDVKYISEQDHQSIIQRSKVDLDDVLFAMIGSIGNPVLVDIEPDFSIKNVALFKYYDRSLVSPSYLLNFLTFAQIKFKSEASGAVQSFVSLSKIRNYVMALPPLTEQHRIAAKVDELMALCDQLEAQTESSLDAHQTLVTVLLDTLVNSKNAEDLAENWMRISGHFDTLFTTEQSIDQLKQTILQLAVMGKLVEQNPNDEPASVLLERIAAEKEELIKQKKIKKQKPLPPITEEEKPFELPEGWEWVRFGWLGYDLGGGTPSKSKADYWDGNIPWVSPKDMKRNYIDSSIDYITAEALDGSTVKLIPINSLLMVVRGMILAHSFPVAITQKPVVINQDMKALVFSELLPDFVLLMLQGFKDKMLQRVDRSSHGTCKLVSEKLWDVVLAIPPLEEQHRIVAKVDELMAICDQLKARLSDAQTTQLNLADALVAQAVD